MIAAFLHLHLSVSNIGWDAKPTQHVSSLTKVLHYLEAEVSLLILLLPQAISFLDLCFPVVFGTGGHQCCVVFFFLAFLDVSLPCHICPSLGFCRRLKTRGVILISVSLQEHETSGRTSRSGVT